MKFKLSLNNFLCLFSVIKWHVFKFNRTPTTMEEKLCHTLMAEVYKKMHTIGVIHQLKYTLKMTPQECMAFWIIYCDHNYSNTSLEGNLLNQMVAQIDQKFS